MRTINTPDIFTAMDERLAPNQGDKGVSSASTLVRRLVARAALVARDTKSPLAAGALAGVVVGCVLGAILIAFCIYPFIVRYRRTRRGDAPFDPEAEIQAASQQSGTNGSSTSPVAKQLSLDHDYGRGQPSSEDSNVASMLGRSNAGQPHPESLQNGQLDKSIHTPPPDGQQQSPNIGSLAGPQRAPTNLTATTFATQMTTPPPEKERRGSQGSTWSTLSKAMRSTTSVFRKTSSRSVPQRYAAQDGSWANPLDAGTIYSEPPLMATANHSTHGAAAAYYFPNGIPVTQMNPPMTGQQDLSSFADPLALHNVDTGAQLGHDISQNFQQQQPDYSGQQIFALATPSHSPDMVNQTFHGTPISGLESFGTLGPVQGTANLAINPTDNFMFLQGADQMSTNGISVGDGIINPQNLNTTMHDMIPGWQADLSTANYAPELLGINQGQLAPSPPQIQMQHQQFPALANQQNPMMDMPVQTILPLEAEDVDLEVMDSVFGGIPGYKTEGSDTATPTQPPAPLTQYPQSISTTNHHLQSSPPLTTPYTPVFIKPEPDTLDDTDFETTFEDVPQRSLYGHKRDYSHSSMSAGIMSNFVNTPNTHITGASSSYNGSLSPCPIPPQGMSPGEAPGSDLLKPFKCPYPNCAARFEEKHKLNHHTRYHDRKYHCKYTNCTASFGTKTHLERHVNDKHTKSRGFHCTVEGCPYSLIGGKSFRRKDNWRRHLTNKHSLKPDDERVIVALPNGDQEMGDSEQQYDADENEQFSDGVGQLTSIQH